MALPSAQIAEDFKEALEDLSDTNRHQIQTLAGLANENSEHALAISREIEKHIKSTASSKKLPALYLLDSLVKNYGKPYSDILARNLPNVFMDAYRTVDETTRRSMEALAKTWKVPVANSGDTKPVFPPDVTRQIDNALAQARSAYLSQQNRTPQPPYGMSRPGIGVPPWGNTATPPPHDPRYPPASAYGHPFGHPPAYPQNPTQHASSYPPGSLPNGVNGFQPKPNPDTAWMNDLSNLINEAQHDSSLNPHDQSLAHKCKALQDLQQLLRTQQLSPDDRKRIRDQVEQLTRQAHQQKAYAALPPQTQPMPPSTSQTYPSYNGPSQAPYPHYGTPQPDASASVAQFAILGQNAWPSARSTPPVPSLPFAPPPANAPPPAAASTGNSVVDALRAAGIISDAPGADRPSSSNQLAAALAPPPSLQALTSTPPVHLVNAISQAVPAARNDLQLTSASLKIARPHLVEAMFAKQPNQCITCGRRFSMDDDGKARKARHLDWHFRVNVKLSEASRRGSTRSWYMKEHDFVRFREVDDSEEAKADNNGSAAEAEKEKPSKVRFVRAPTDSTLSKQPCPICQEPFQTSWHEEAQEWVWMDAVQVGARIYHGSCRDEISRGSDNTTAKRLSPDSVLGKRKVEGISDLEKRVKREVAAS